MGRYFSQYSYVESDLPDECPLHSAYLDYVLEDGTRLHVHQADYYCPACEQFVMGEQVETIWELERQINDLENNPDSHFWLLNEFQSIAERIAELHVRIDWRKKRQSPPKCLQCGTVDIFPIPDREEFNHPATGQRMKKTGFGFASSNEWHATFTPEGDQIESIYK